MKDFTYYAPTKMIFGKDKEKTVGDVIKSYGYKKILLHYGQQSIKKTGLYDTVTESLTKAGIAYIELPGAEPNPKTPLVREGAALCKKEGVELVLAVGGGSVADSAKVIAICALEDNDPFDYPTKKATAAHSLPVGIILTLSASGSEMSQSAVLTEPETKEKRGFNCEHNRPLFSILNPELTYTVSPFQTGCGIVDIMMHTMERYFAPGEHCDLTDGIALSLLRSVVDAGRAAMQNPNDYAARATLMWAGSVSHNDLTSCGKNYILVCHQLEHILSGEYDFVAHGAGLSVIFPAWCKYVYKHDQKKFAAFAKVVFDVTDGPLEKMAEEGVLRCEAYFKEIKMPIRMAELDVHGADFADMAEKCTYNGTRTLPGIMELGKKEIEEIFRLTLA